MANEKIKEDFEIIIKEELHRYGEIEKVMSAIQEKYKKTELSNIDKNYIIKKYIKYCKEFCLIEAQNFIKNVKTHSELQSIMSSPDTLLQRFEDLKFCRLLMQNIDEKDLTIFFKELKNVCLHYIAITMEDEGKVLEFFERLIDFLSDSIELSHFLENSKLKEFCNGHIDFHELTDNIKTLKLKDSESKYALLNESIPPLDDKKEFFLLEFMKKELIGFTRSVEIKVTTVDGRLALELKGLSIVVSRYIPKIEQILSEKQHIEEIRIIAEHTIHIDVNIDFWHGKNILLIAKKIRVHREIHWNVSGKDNDHKYTNNAGTDEVTGNGNDGADGFPGQSGGNVSIYAHSFENSELFSITSNGGRGSDGQDGGNGRDGRDGKSIKFCEFKEQFQPIASTIRESSDNLKHTIALLKAERNHVEIDIEEFRHRFINVITECGNDVTFSFAYYLPFVHKEQTLILYKGAKGQSGGNGGEYGFGGEGGFAGEITIKVFNESTLDVGFGKTTKHGEDGKKGSGGLFGNFGKNGWDVGYVDYDNFFSNRWPIYYGRDENSTLSIEYHSDSRKDNVWCPYKDRFVSIKSSPLKNKLKKFEKRKRSSKTKSERQQHSKAVRQKSISEVSVQSSYSHILMSANESKLIGVRSELENIRENALQEIDLREEQNIQQKFQLKVTRVARFPSNNSHSRDYQSSEPIQIQDVFSDSLDPNDAFNDISNIVSLNAHNNNFRVTVQSNDDNDSNLISIGNNMQQSVRMNKLHRFSILQEVSKQLPEYYKLNLELSALDAETARNFLISAEGHTSVSHPVLGSLEQYIHANTPTEGKKVVQFCDGIMQQKYKNVEALLLSIRMFIWEFDGPEEETEEIKHFFNTYTFKNKEKKGLLGLLGELDGYVLKGANIYDQFKKFLLQRGSSSNAYMVFLAHAFNVNIRTYDKDEELNEFCLRFDYNTNATDTIYLLQRNNKFIPLKINKNLLLLFKHRQFKDRIYRNILMDVETKQDLDTYLSSKQFQDDFIEDYAENEIEQFYQKYYSKEDEELDAIAECFRHEPDLKIQLEKLTFEILGQRGITYYISERFLVEGTRVSAPELYYVINYVLNYYVEYDQVDTHFTFSWIFAAFPQDNWLDEIILLQLEDRFGQQLEEKLRWRQFLSNISNKGVILLFGEKLSSLCSLTVKCVSDILRLLSIIPDQSLSLQQLELSEWPCRLKEAYWANKLSKLADWSSDDLQRAKYYVLSIANIFGEDLVEKFVAAIDKKVLKILPEELTFILRRFYSQKWILEDNVINDFSGKATKTWIKYMDQKCCSADKERCLSELTEIIQNNANTSEEIIKLLPAAIVGIHNPITSECGYAKQLAEIDKVIEQKRKFHLRDTQKLAVLLLLRNESSTLAQVSTGEGKSLIVVAASILKALNKEKVDVVTSSSVLAMRDSEINKDIYQHFKITVSHNCSDDVEKRRNAYSSNSVVYGELSNFQRDYLLDTFYGKNILGDRKPKNVIIDEVDSLLLDKGNNMLYLSHDLSSMDKLEAVYIYIWKWINKPAINREEIKECFDIAEIKKSVLMDLYGLITIEDICDLDPKLKQHATAIWNCLVKADVLDNMGKLKIKTLDSIKFEEILSPEHRDYYDRLKYLLLERIKREKQIHVPNYLKPFTERHLDSWIRSAISAFSMQPGQDYVIDLDRTGASLDRSPNIIILDTDTGTDQTSSQWDEALHQFLQLKHGCKLSMQSLKTVFISNVSFFKMYRKIYGLTGTLGSQVEREILNDIHNVEFFTLPTAKAKQLEEIEPIICADSNEWAASICKESENLTKYEKRSVLIICETINDAESLYKKLVGKNVKMYTRQYDELDLIQDGKALDPGQIIIATNLAGRGTDIKITDGLRNANGLHVILTYLPGNARVEEQAFGRAARCGDKGSAQLIILNPSRSNDMPNNIFKLKQTRDQQEEERLSKIKRHYETVIKTEENCFKEFEEVFGKLKRNLTTKKVPEDLKEILLQSCLEKWAFWLDANGSYIKTNATTDDQQKLKKNLLDLTAELSDLRIDCWESWVIGNPVQMVKLGLYNVLNKKGNTSVDIALELFNAVIKCEPNFSETAHYYKAFVMLQLKENIKDIEIELRKAAKLLDEHCKTTLLAGCFIDAIKKENRKSILQIDAFKQQHITLARIYRMFSGSIEDVFGHPVTPSCFSSCGNKYKMYEVYQALIDKQLLSQPRVEYCSDETIEEIGIVSGVSPESLKQFLSKYFGKDINEEQFRKDLKNQIKLPSRKLFWNYLTTHDCLLNDVKYVSYDDEEISQLIQNKMESNELKKFTHSDIDDTKTWLLEPEKNCVFFEKKAFKEAIGAKSYKMLKRSRVLSFYRSAQFDTTKLSSIKFPLFDSITVQDFAKVNIMQGDAAKIVSELLKSGVIKEKPNQPKVFMLNISFDDIDERILVPSFPVYEDALRRLLCMCFKFRRELERLIFQLSDETTRSSVRVQLETKSHNQLMFAFLEKDILVPIKVNTENYKNAANKIKELYPIEDNLIFGKNTVADQILSVLKNSKSSLDTLKTPDAALKHFTEVRSKGELGNAEELNAFSLNGSDKLLELKEKKWSSAMLKSTALVVAIGISQVAIGAYIQLYSAGSLSHVGFGLFNEGISDLFFAVTASNSGHWEWGDYLQHKYISIAQTALTCGFAVWASNSTKLSHFGEKLAGSALFKDGEGTALMTANKLITTVGVKKVINKVGKQIIYDAGNAIDKGIANSGAMCDQILRNFTDKIIGEVWDAFDKKMNEIDTTRKIGKVYDSLGAIKGKKLVRSALKKFNSTYSEINKLKQNFVEVLKTYENSLADIKSNSQDVRSLISIEIKSINYSFIVILIISITKSFLNSMETLLREKESDMISCKVKQYFQKSKQNKKHSQDANDILDQELNIKNNSSDMISSAGATEIKKIATEPEIIKPNGADINISDNSTSIGTQNISQSTKTGQDFSTKEREEFVKSTKEMITNDLKEKINDLLYENFVTPLISITVEIVGKYQSRLYENFKNNTDNKKYQ